MDIISAGFLVNLTSLSLLDRLKHAQPDAADWQRLHDIYLPLIRSWLSARPGFARRGR